MTRVNRPSCKQRCCIRPCNNGDTPISANDEMRQDFENFFNPFSKQYDKVNFVCRPKSTRVSIPIATQGSGSLGGKNCREKCPLNGNENNNVGNLFELWDKRFDDQFNSMTDLYQATNTVCRNYNAPGLPYADRGSGAPNACKIGCRTKRGCRDLGTNNVIGDFTKKELEFDDAIRLSEKCRVVKDKCQN